MLLMPLMRMTPPFWMRPVRPEIPYDCPLPTVRLQATRLSIGAAASPLTHHSIPIPRVT